MCVAPFVPLAEPTMTSWDALPLAKRWVERCRNTHRLCNVPTSHVLPTRLICVRGTTPYLLIKGLNYHEYEEGSVLRSVKSNYTTLSHCCEYCSPICSGFRPHVVLYKPFCHEIQIAV